MAPLEELTERLEQVAGRIRGTPIGKELLDIARQLRERCAEGPPRGLSEAPTEDAAAAALAPELHRTVDRLLEEREELRRTFDQQVTSAMDAQVCAEGRAERFRLLAESGGGDPDGLAAQFALALTEESEVARAARSDLLAQAEALRGELAAERSTTRCLRAELTALRAMSREGRAEAAARPRRHTPSPQPSASPPSASPAQTPPPGSPRGAWAGADEEPPVGPMSSEADKLLMRPRRSVVFAGRDFSEDAAAAPHPWRAEVVELDERASREGWKARWSEGLEPSPDASGTTAPRSGRS